MDTATATTQTPKHPTPTMVSVKSSQISKIGYDATTKTIVVEFKGGAVYHYHDQPESRYEGLLKAESKGKYLGQHLKGNDDKGAPKFRYTRIGVTHRATA